MVANSASAIENFPYLATARETKIPSIVEKRLQFAQDYAKSFLNKEKAKLAGSRIIDFNSLAKFNQLEQIVSAIKPEIMPLHIGGYYNPETGDIRINYYHLVHATQAKLNRIVLHEIRHALQTEDEASTDLFSKYEESWGDDDGEDTGYDPIVKQLKHLAQKAGATPLDLKIEEFAAENPTDKAVGYIFRLFAYPQMQYANNQSLLSISRLESLIAENWGIFKGLFPRLVAKIDTNALAKKLLARIVEEICFNEFEPTSTEAALMWNYLQQRFFNDSRLEREQVVEALVNELIEGQIGVAIES